MACNGCAERGEALANAIEAYRRGDMPEAKRLLKEALGSFVSDINSLTRLVVKGPDGKIEQLDFRPDKLPPRMPGSRV